jgi:hypothetical protein
LRASWLFTFTFVAVSLAHPAHAALYQFTIEGTVTYALLPYAQVGDPFTVEYFVDSEDLSAPSTSGFYRASGVTVKFPAGTIVVDGGQPQLGVSLGEGIATDHVEYSTYGVIDPFYVSVGFLFPPGTLVSDELPQSLPLTSATMRRLRVAWGGLEDVWRGNVTAYSSVKVPEPLNVFVATLLVTVCRRHVRIG